MKLKQKEKDAEERKKIDEQKKQLDLEISLNPNNFLQVVFPLFHLFICISVRNRLSPTSLCGSGGKNRRDWRWYFWFLKLFLKNKKLLERAKIVAEAFKDDDVIAEFEQEKEIVNFKYKILVRPHPLP